MYLFKRLICIINNNPDRFLAIVLKNFNIFFSSKQIKTKACKKEILNLNLDYCIQELTNIKKDLLTKQSLRIEEFEEINNKIEQLIEEIKQTNY